ncbi:MAG: hypothetical protein NVSMB47_09340 [Polyangiales bacterium]
MVAPLRKGLARVAQPAWRLPGMTDRDRARNQALRRRLGEPTVVVRAVNWGRTMKNSTLRLTLFITFLVALGVSSSGCLITDLLGKLGG